jgi:predicted ferric reductase
VNPQLWWYVSRASGIVAWALVTVSVVLGLVLSLRMARKRPKPAWVSDLHRFVGGLAVLFTGAHLAALALDSYVELGARDLLVPFASPWQTTAVAWGILALYGLLAVEITSLAMRRLPRRLWRSVHLLSFAVFALLNVHVFTAGTDRTNPLLQWVGLLSVGVVGFLTIARVLAGRRRPTSAADLARSRRPPSVPERPGAARVGGPTHKGGALVG